MVESLIMLLIYICGIAAVVWLVLYVLQTALGWAIPDQIVKIIWVIVFLVVLLLILRLVLPIAGISLP